MKSKSVLLVVSFIFIISFLAGNWLNKPDNKVQQLEKVTMQYSACDPTINECQAMLQASSVSTLFLQNPTALQPFEIEVRIDNSDIEFVGMDFRMPSMNMGVHYYRLNKSSEGVWKGEVILPVCASRRSDWVGELQINYLGKLWIAEYMFTQSMEN